MKNALISSNRQRVVSLPIYLPDFQRIWLIFFASILLMFVPKIVWGQTPTTPKISDFVLFSGAANAGNSVQLNSSTTINGGIIGSNKLVKSTGSSTINASIYSQGTIELTNSNTVTGKIAASNSQNLSGTILSVGSNANLLGNIDVNGNIVVGGGVVSGVVTSSTSYTGPTPGSGPAIIGTPSLPVFPSLPAITSFAPYNSAAADITKSAIINPGAHNSIKLSGSQILTFHGPGVYIFNGILNKNSNTLRFDFRNQAGNFYLHVHNNASLAKINVEIINGGSASRIYTEIHGTGLGTGKYAFEIVNGSPGGSRSKWEGTVWAPYAAINMGSGTGSSDLTGALYSGTQVNIQSGVTINHAPFEFCFPPSVNAGTDVNVCANPGQITLTASATGGTAPYTYTWSNGMTGESITISPTSTTTYTVTVANANSNCSASDAVVVNVNSALSVNAGADKKVCNGNTATSLTAVASGGTAPYTYEWFVNATSVGTGATLAVAPAVTTSYTVVAKDNFGVICTATDAVVVIVNNALNANAGGDVQVCINENETTLTASASGGTGPYTYEWFNGNVSLGTSAGVTVSPSATTTYTVVAKDSFGAAVACSATDQVTITVNPVPALTVLDAKVEVCSAEVGGNSALVDLTTYVTVEDGTTTAFSNENGDPISNPLAYEVVESETITVVATNGSSCESTTTFIVKVNARQIFGICSQGKVYDLIGSELTILSNLFDPNAADPITTNTVFFIDGDKVLIEIIYINRPGSTDPTELLSIIESTNGDFGFEFDPEISDLEEDFIIAGFFPIANLKNLNDLEELIQYVRPAFPPVVGAEYLEKVGGAMTQGDIVMRSDLVRLGYQNDDTGFPISGSGIKVGVLSDSYNSLSKLGGNPAATDVAQDELPGPGGSLIPSKQKYQNNLPVDIIKEFPFEKYGVRSDEGRAMLQIIHDVAPRAELAFRTGFLTAGDFTKGILQLASDDPTIGGADCDVIVDDITYVTEPFFTDGKVAQAVNYVASQGVSYFTSAGNFGNKSFEGTFTPVDPSIELPKPGKTHDFGGGDTQSITVGPGTYTVVLQWDDPLYSVGGSTPSGSQYDMDIYLSNFLGYERFGYNRVNTGGDPIEVLSFYVPEGLEPITTDLVIAMECADCSNVAGIDFKYVIFRGNITDIEHFGNGSSTIVGQANAAGAMTVGAVLYSNTDVIFNTTVPARPADCSSDPLPIFSIDDKLTVASFSSLGGMQTKGVTAVENQNRFKPDFIGPNGVNTTVVLSDPKNNFDCDTYQNFYGTSAAAPHAAGVAALLLEARNYYYPTTPPTNANWTNTNMADNVRSAMKNTSLNMHEAGFDTKSGSGLIKAHTAMLTLAAPNPEIIRVDYSPSDAIPGNAIFTVVIQGNNFYEDSEILFNGGGLPTTYDPTTGTLSAVIPEFPDYQNPPLQVDNPAMTSREDGGTTDPYYFYGERPKRVRIVAENPSPKKYGEIVRKDLFTAHAEVQQEDGSYAPIALDQVGLYLEGNPTTDVLGNPLVKLTLNTDATSLDPVKLDGYLVVPSHAPVADYFAAKYIYNSDINILGNLVVERLPMKVVPNPVAVVYGDQIEITFDYQYDETNIDPTIDFEEVIKAQHRSTYVNPLNTNEVIGLLDSRKLITDSNDRSLTPADLENFAFLTSGSRGIANGSRGITNGSRGITNVIDLDKESIYEYQGQTPPASSTTLTNTRGIANGSRGIVNTRGIANGSRGIVNTATNGSRGITNGSRGITNAEGVLGDSDYPESNEDVAVIVHEIDVTDPENYSEEDDLWIIPEFYSLNMITGLTAGHHYSVPGALLSENLNLTYGVGDVTIEKADLKVIADDKQMAYGGSKPTFTPTYEGFQYEDDAASVIESVEFALTNGDGTPAIEPLATGIYSIVPTATLIQSEYETFPGNPLVNYTLIYEPGTLEVFCENAIIKSSVTSTGGGSSVPTVNKPENTNEGDLMIVGLVYEKGTQTNVSPSAGWNLIQRTNQTNNLGIGTYWKIAGDNEPNSYSFPLSNSPKWSMGITTLGCADTSNPLYITNPSTNSPIDKFAGKSSSAKTTFADAPSITPSVDNTLVMAFYANKTNASWTPASGTTEVYDVPNDQQGLTSNMMAYYIQPKAGGSGTGDKRAIASYKEVWVAQQIAVKAAPVGSIAGRNSTASTSTSTNNVEFVEKQQSTLGAYPNPVRSSLNIVVEGVAEEPSFSVVDAIGRMYSVNRNWFSGEQRLELDFSSLQDGLYSVVVRTDKGAKTIRVIKRMD